MNTKFTLTVQKDGSVSFGCDTAVEAAELAKALSGSQTVAPKPTDEVKPAKKMWRPVGSTTKKNKDKARASVLVRMTGEMVGLGNARNVWTDEEVQRIYELITTGARNIDVCSDPLLRLRHAPNALSNTYFILKNDKYIKMGLKTSFYRKYDAYKKLMSGKSAQEQQNEFVSTRLEQIEADKKNANVTNAPPIPTMGWSRS